jgi:hypothetical protein
VVGGFEPQSWALVGAGFTQLGSMPTPQVPPADAHALPGVDDVHDMGIVPNADNTQMQVNIGRGGIAVTGRRASA